MSSFVRVGIIGTSRWAERMHIPCVKSHDKAQLIAVCGRNREHAEEVAGKHGIPKVFTDYREMIEIGDLDAIIVATPDDLRYRMTLDATAAGLHVVCEKPLGYTVTEAREMFKNAESARIKHMTYFTWKWLPHIQYMRRLVAEGRLGEPLQCHMHFLEGDGAKEKKGPQPFRRDRERSNGRLGDVGAHLFDFARWFIGDFAKVSANLTSFAMWRDADGKELAVANDSVVLASQFKNGAQGIFAIGAASGDSRQRVRLIGRDGVLETSYSFAGALNAEHHIAPEITWKAHKSNQTETLSVPKEYGNPADAGMFLEPFLSLPAGDRLFIDAILDDIAVEPSFYDGWKVQEVIDAAVRSDAEQRWINIY